MTATATEAVLFDLEITVDWDTASAPTAIEPGWTSTDYGDCGSGNPNGTNSCGASGRPCICPW